MRVLTDQGQFVGHMPAPAADADHVGGVPVRVGHRYFADGILEQVYRISPGDVARLLRIGALDQSRVRRDEDARRRAYTSATGDARHGERVTPEVIARWEAMTGGFGPESIFEFRDGKLRTKW